MAEETTTDTADPKPAKARIDLATIGGLVLAFSGILGGLLIEGGKVKDVVQFTAALIVLGGTIGAVLVSTPLSVLRGAARRLAGVFLDPSPDYAAAMHQVIGYATKARKNGLVSLEHDADMIEDPFLRKALSLAVDGADLQDIRKMLELEIQVEEERAEAEAKVFESAGGFAPTVGIIGAVLGLIQVMKNLANIDEVGRGIAVSFVATVYGVGTANLFFLPAASKIKARSHAIIQRKELILEGVLGIVEGLNPKLIRSKLEAFTIGSGPAGQSKTGRNSKKEEAPAALEA